MSSQFSGSAYWRLSSIYFFYFALLGAIAPFWNLYLAGQGYTAVEIGYLGAILMGTKVLSPYLLGWLTDRTGRPVKIIRYSNFAALLFFLLIYSLPQPAEGEQQFWQLAFIVAGFSFFWNAVVGQYEALTFLYLGKQHHRYGSIRGWGSVGFVAAVTLLGYLFEAVEIDYLPDVISLLLLAIWLSSCFVREIEGQGSMGAAAGEIPFFAFIRRPEVLAFFAGCFLVKFAHGPFYTFYSIYLDAWGYSSSAIGWLWSLGVIAELAMFFVIAGAMQRYSLRFILAMSGLSGILRWLLVAAAPQMLGVQIISQLLHALTFASYHAAAVNWVRQTFGAQYQGQGQALYSATSFGAGSAVGAIVSGYIWTDEPSIAWTWAWIMAAGLSLLAGLVFWLGMREQQPSQ